MEITAAIVKRLSHAPLAARADALRSASRIARGASSEVWRIDTAKNTYAMRLLTGRHSKTAALADIHIRTLLHAQAPAVAQPIAHSYATRPLSAHLPDWILDQYISGAHPTRANLSPPICADIGKVLARLHRLDCTGFGKPDILADGLIKGACDEPLSGLHSRFTAPLPISKIQWAAHPFHRLAGFHMRLLPHLHQISAEIATSAPVICHSDLHEQQFICATSNGGRLNALIDFADVTLADRRWDFASLYYFHGAEALSATISAYCDDPHQRQALNSGAKLFSLSLALHHAARSALP